jgi:hypothetical protein
MSITGIRKFRPGSFNTIIMMGNNFGLFGGFDKARRLLKQLYRITSADGQIIAETRDPCTLRIPDSTVDEAEWEASLMGSGTIGS